MRTLVTLAGLKAKYGTCEVVILLSKNVPC